MTDTPENPVAAAFAAAEPVTPMEGGAPPPDAGAPPAAGGDGGGDGGGNGLDLEALMEAAGLPLNDFGNGRRFALHFGADTLFVPRVGWFRWSGTAWEKDEDRLAVRRLAQGLGDLIAAEIPYIHQTTAERAAFQRAEETERRLRELEALDPAAQTDEQAAELAEMRERGRALDRARQAFKKRSDRHRSFATSAGNSARIRAALEEAETALDRPYEAMDADPLAINTESGLVKFRVIDMRDEGGGRQAEVQLVPHAREQLVTKLCPVPYVPDAACPGFDAFLQRIQPDRDVRAFLQRWLGLSLTGLKQQRLVFLYGGGANGKSVLVDLCARIAGTYGATARIESLTGSNRRGGGDATPDLIPLMGARLVRTSEPDEGQRLQEGLIKELTGGEPIQVRALHSDFVEIRPIFKLTMSGNHKPDIRGTDDGIWRRVLLVPFDVQIPEEEREEGLADRLFAEEAPGILAWMLEGLREVLEGGLAPPDQVVEATREYRAEQDPLGVFLASCCVVTGDPADTMRSAELVNAFAYHRIERGEGAWQPTTVARRLSTKAGQWRHPETGARFEKGKASVSQYLGLRLTDAFARRFRDAPKDTSGRPLGPAHNAPTANGTPHPDSDF